MTAAPAEPGVSLPFTMTLFANLLWACASIRTLAGREGHRQSVCVDGGVEHRLERRADRAGRA